VELLALFWLCGEPHVGVFALALRVVEFLVMVPSAVAGGAMPALAREARGDSLAVRRRTAFTVGLLAGASSLGLLLVAPGVPAVFGGAEYSGTEGPMRVLALAIPPLFFNVLLAFALTAAGRPERLPRLTTVRVLLSLLLALFLAPRFGAFGAAVGFLVSEVTILLLGIAACREVRFPVPIAGPLSAGVGLALPMAGVVALSGDRLVTQLIAGGGAWSLTMGAFYYLTRRRRVATSET
jgi:O-antigen/teichoic acid export membrane protein